MIFCKSTWNCNVIAGWRVLYYFVSKAGKSYNYMWALKGHVRFHYPVYCKRGDTSYAQIKQTDKDFHNNTHESAYYDCSVCRSKEILVSDVHGHDAVCKGKTGCGYCYLKKMLLRNWTQRTHQRSSFPCIKNIETEDRYWIKRLRQASSFSGKGQSPRTKTS